MLEDRERLLIMTSSKKILPDEEELRPPHPPAIEDEPPSHSHRRRWSSPGESCGAGSLSCFSVESLAGNSDYNNEDGNEHQSVSGTNLDGYLTSLSERRYSFYLGPELSPWGPLAPPLLTDARSPTPAVERRRERTETRKEDFPPFLTTLYSNGRPRFRLRRVRSAGRLEIVSVAVEGPELVRDRGREGLRIGTVRISQEEEEEDDKKNH